MHPIGFDDPAKQFEGDFVVFDDEEIHFDGTGHLSIGTLIPGIKRVEVIRSPPRAVSLLLSIVYPTFSTLPPSCPYLVLPMNPVLKLLLEGSQLTTAQIAQVAGLTDAEVNQHLEQLKKDKIFLGWRPVLDLSEHEAAAAAVRAVIEVRITPERGGGFNRLAERIGRFDEVESCYLMSGGYDLLLFISKGKHAAEGRYSFVSEKLSTIEGVLSTSTHFMLRSYKEGGYLLDSPAESSGRLKVSP